MATGTPIRHSALIFLLVCAGCGPAARGERQARAVYNNALSLEYRRPARALDEADRGFKEWSHRPDSAWHWRFRLLKAQLLLAQGDVKNALPLLDGDVPSVPDRPVLMTRLALERCHAAYIRGDYQASARYCDDALARASAAGSDRLIAETLLRQAGLSLREGVLGKAEADLRRAAPHARHDGNEYLNASILAMRGVLLMQRAYYDGAIPWTERALELSIKQDFSALVPPLLGDLAFCQYRLGDLDAALASAQRAQRLYGEMHLPLQEQIDLGTLGNIYYARGQVRDAVAAYERALEIAAGLKDNYWRAKWLNNLALADLDSGDLSGAEGYNDQALALQQARNDRRAIVFPELNAARIHARRGDYPAARAILEQITRSSQADPAVQWDAHTELARVYQATHEPDRALREYQRASAHIEEARARLEKDSSKLTLPSHFASFYDLYVDFLVSQGRVERALEIVEAGRARVLAEKLGVSPASAGRAVDFVRVARVKRCVILSYWLAPKRSFLWAVTGAGIRLFELPPEQELARLIAAHAAQIEGDRDPAGIQDSAGARLYDLLVKPAAHLIPPNGRVIVVAGGELHRLNPDTLVDPSPSPHYWIRDVTVSVAPSISLIKPRRDRSLRSPSLLLVGAPVTTAAAGTPALAYARAELDGIAHSFAGRRTTVLEGAAATPEHYRAAHPADYALIHFAAHTDINAVSPLDSAILLSPGADTYKLYARDLESTPLEAQLVTLSACRGAGARTFVGEGLVGLTWALLRAGAQNVIAGLWDVPDASTAELMRYLYSGLAGGATPEQALRAAQLKLLDSPGAFRKPYYWAAFQVYSR
jgi:CHAT domain-containing protein/tetratricopeptide (TPR) repeat protein